MEVLITADRIHTRVGELAAEIAHAYEGKPVTVVGILTGCLIFTADLIRRIDLPLRVAFVKRLRGEKRFANVEELIAQMKLDVEEAREVCATFQQP